MVRRIDVLKEAKSRIMKEFDEKINTLQADCLHEQSETKTEAGRMEYVVEFTTICKLCDKYLETP